MATVKTVTGPLAPWGADPAGDDVIWYGEALARPGEGDTDYFYGYSAEADPPVEALCPDGWEVLESKRLPVPQTRARFRLAGHPGVAYRYVGRAVIGHDEDGEEELSDSQLTMVMVGDDYEWTVDVQDVYVLADGAYCAACGQLGCTHDGR